MDVTQSSTLHVGHHAWNGMTAKQEMGTLHNAVPTAIWPIQCGATSQLPPPSTGILACFKRASLQITNLRNQSFCKRSSTFNPQGSRQNCQKLNKCHPNRIPRNERVTLPPVHTQISARSPVLPPSTAMPESVNSGSCPSSQSWSSSTSSSVISSRPPSPSVQVPKLFSVHRSHSLSSTQVPSVLTSSSPKRWLVQDVSPPLMPVLSPVIPEEPRDYSTSPSMPVLTKAMEPGLSFKKSSESDEVVCQPLLCTKKLSFSPVPKGSSKRISESDDIIRRWSSTYPKSPQTQKPQQQQRKPKQQQMEEPQHKKPQPQRQILQPHCQILQPQHQTPQPQYKKLQPHHKKLQPQHKKSHQQQKPQEKPSQDIGRMNIDDIFQHFSTSSKQPGVTAAVRTNKSMLFLSDCNYDVLLESLNEKDDPSPNSEKSIPSLPATAPEDNPRISLPSDCAKRKLVYNNNKLIPLKKRFNPNFEIQSAKEPDSPSSTFNFKKPVPGSPTSSKSGGNSKGEKYQRNKSGRRYYKGATFEIGGTNRTSRAREPIEGPSTEKETISHLKELLMTFMSMRKTSTSIIIHSSKRTRLIEFAGLCYISAVRITGGVRLRKSSYSRAPIGMDVEWMLS